MNPLLEFIKQMQVNFCENCPYDVLHAEYDDDYEKPCLVHLCYVKKFVDELLRD